MLLTKRRGRWLFTQTLTRRDNSATIVPANLHSSITSITTAQQKQSQQTMQMKIRIWGMKQMIAAACVAT